MPTTHDALDALFHPRAVAVIGASDDGTKHGYIVLNNIRDTGFTGGVYGISRRLTEVNGIPCFPTLADVPEPVDVAFLAIPAEAAVQAVRDCARAGLKAVIVGSAGYAESLDAGGAERQRELQRIAAAEGIRIVGPNCNGIYNAHHPVSIGFNTSHAKRQTPGGVSIFSHSGALFDAMAGRLAMAGEGLSLFASAGNEADMSVLDYMEYAITHAPTKVIALLIDSLEDGPRFRALARRAYDAGKPVVALKIGGSEAGAAAAIAHSSRLAGDAAAYRALFDASGVAVVSTLEGLLTASALLARYGRRPGRLGALSTSGAGASLIADRCEALGIPLAPLTETTRAALDGHKMFSRIGNPLDLGIFGGMRRSGEVPALLMGDPQVSVVLALLHSMNPWQGDPYRAAMARAREITGRPVLVVSPGGLPEAERATYASFGMDVFTETDIVLEGIGAMLTPPPAPMPTITAMPAPALPARQLTEPESLALLASFGVNTVATEVCDSAAAARAAAERIGFPVVLKGIAEGVAHKSDLGLVHVGLRDADAVSRAFTATSCANVVVQAMIAGDLEAIAGVTRADGVGLVLLAGLGGIHAEALHDVTMWPIPVGRETIERRLRGSALGRVLHGPRWKHPDAAAAFVDLLLGLQTAAVSLGDRLHAIDVNPVILGPHGAIAVDALVIPPAMTDRFTVVYHVRSEAAAIEARAAAIAVEQSVEMPLAGIDEPAVLTDIVGQVQTIDDLGGGTFAVHIGLATATVGDDPGQWLNMLFGNTSLHDDVVLRDVEVPERFRPAAAGGTPELRRRLGVPRRAFTGSALKPQGLSPRRLATLAERFARGGLDFIKDDHGLADQTYSPFAERVPLIAAAVSRAGGATRYIPSLTGDLDALRTGAAIARDQGLDCMMVAPMIAGFPAVRALTRAFPDVTFFAHPAMGGAARIPPELLIGKLFPALGCGAVIFPTFGGRFGYSPATCRQIAANARPALAVPAGGIVLSRVAELLDFYGPDTMLLIGGNLLLARERITEEAAAFADAVARHGERHGQ